jgi:DNA-binding NarL/FixJ family response regulator
MSWQTLDPAVRETAERVLTEKQLDAWRLEADGSSIRDIAFRLDIAKTTASDRLEAAHRILRRAGVRMSPNGIYYLEESA